MLVQLQLNIFRTISQTQCIFAQWRWRTGMKTGNIPSNWSPEANEEKRMQATVSLVICILQRFHTIGWVNGRTCAT